MLVPEASGQTPLVFATAVDDEPAPAPRERQRPRARPAPPPPPPSPVIDPYGLDEAADPGFEVLPDDEPLAGGRVSGSRSWGRGCDGPNLPLIVGGMVGGVVLLALVVWWAASGSRSSGVPGGGTGATAAGAPAAGASGQAEPPPLAGALPPLPPRRIGREVEPGVLYQEVVIGPGHARPGVPPGHGMTMWLYLPTGQHAPGSLPCVLIAPAGSIVITGNELSESGAGDHPEHLPWARAGFAVLAYGLDGALPDAAQGDVATIRQASAAFHAARAGLTNAEVALAWLAARVPEVDPNRVYAAGHSSAGATALLLAEHDPRINACVAFGPRSDVEGNFNFAQKIMLRGGGISWLDEFFTAYNPKNHAAELRGPVFLFHARDDTVVPVSETEAFAAELQRLGKRVNLVTVPTGGHYEGMIAEGVPRAIEWLRGVDRGR
jgi:dienelactone hydrolase